MGELPRSKGCQNDAIVRLSEEEQQQLKELVSKGQAAAHNLKHANIR